MTPAEWPDPAGRLCSAVVGCDDMKLLAMPYLDGELAAPEIREVELHLRDCEACRVTLVAERARADALRARGKLPVPPAVRDRLATALDLEDATAGHLRVGHGPWILPLLSSLIALVALVLFVRAISCG